MRQPKPPHASLEAEHRRPAVAEKPSPPEASDGEIAALIDTLHRTEQRLEQLTAGEVDTISDSEGRTILLRRSQEYMRFSEAAKQTAILNALPAHIALLDAQGVIISVNETWRRFAGANGLLASEAAVGLNYLEVCDRAVGKFSAEAGSVAEGIRAILFGGANGFAIEYPCHAPGEQRWFLMTVSPLPGNSAMGAVVMHLDITGRRRVEEEHRTTNLLLDNIVENIPTAVHLKSVQDGLRIQLWNKASEAMYGLPAAQAIGRNVHDIWPAADADRMEAADLDLMKWGGMQDFPDRVAQTKDRGDIRVHMRKVRLVDAAGNATHLLVIADDITEQLKQTEELRRFRAAMDVSGDGIVLIDRASLRYIYVNQTLCDLVGRSRQEILATMPVDMFSADRETQERDYDAIIADQDSPANKREGYYDRPDGVRVVVETRRRALRAGDSWVIVGTVRDITDRKRAERALRESELRFRQVAENIRSVFFLRDADGGRMLYVSPAYEEIWGRSRESLYADAQSWSEAIHPDDRAANAEKSRLGLLAGEFDIEYRVLRPDGSMRWVESRGFPVLDRDGKVTRIAGIAEDVTERKLAARNLRESERRFSDMLENVQLVSVMLDREGRITYCNDYLLRLTGWQFDEVIGESWFEHFMPSELGDMKVVFAALLADRPEARHRDDEIVTRSGKRRLIRWNNSLLRAGSGEVIGTASIGEDITERREAEKRIAQLNRVYAVLGGINALIVRAGTGEELYAEACRITVEVGGFRMAMISIVDRVSKKIVPVASAGKNPELLAAVKALLASNESAPNSMVARAIRERMEEVANDSQTDPRVLIGDKYAQAGVRSMAVLPLIVAGAAIGTFALYAHEKDFFHAGEMKLLKELAGDISFAIDHLEKERKVARLTRVQAVLSDINALIVRVRDKQTLFDGACWVLVEHGKFRMAWIGVVDKPSGRIRPAGRAGEVRDFFEKAPLAITEAKPDGLGLAGRALAEMKPMFSNDAQNDPQILMRAEMAERGINSVAMLPLVVGGEAIGVLALYAADAGFFDDEELRLLRELGGNISFAIDHLDKQGRLDYLAYYDALTGLANRTLFLERVAGFIAAAGEKGRGLAVVLIDVERFKLINETLGREAGDELLRQIAARFVHGPSEQARYARIGADQFAVTIPEIESEEWLVRRVEQSLERYFGPRFRIGNTELKITVRLGVAVFPGDGDNAELLLANAESALKKAKAGGEKYLFYTQEMTKRIAGRLALENQLRQALEDEEFVLHYQPKVNMASGRVTGAEALIRWNDPRTGLVPPGRFIPILEETGLIYDVGRWALGKAIDDHLRWKSKGLATVRIAVNVSPLQLRERNFIAEIEGKISVDVDAAAGLELEITESLIMEDVTRNIATLKAIRELGVTIALDDFGTGYSSLSLLGKLPVDILKIDRSFVIEMTVSPEGLALVSTIIGLAHSLNLKVVAEGVETEEQSRLLRLLKCDEMQGFLFSKPVPAETFEEKFLSPFSAG